MKKKSKHPLVNHVGKFIKEMSIGPFPRVYVAVSGGIDSMVLLWCLKQVMDCELIVLHINHGTRTECDLEERLVHDFAKELEVEFRSFKLSLDINSANFEMKARDARYGIFESELVTGDGLALAHHIDDSFEWSLMNQLKSGNLKSTLGIPALNGNTFRPFMALTKNQVRYLQRTYDIPYMRDTSSEVLRFERNYLRSEIIPKIKERYPRYLKHYVYRQNSLATRLGLHLVSNRGTWIVKKIDGGYCLFANDNNPSLDDFFMKLTNCLESMTKLGRGRLRTQSDVLFGLIKQKKISGPVSLSGGVSAFCEYQKILLIDKAGLELLRKKEEGFIASIDSQIPCCCDKMIHSNFELLISKNHPSVISSMKKVHPLYPKLTQYLLDRGYWFRSPSGHYEKFAARGKTKFVNFLPFS
jgi:tRNA(Ile)-lysidine synthase